MQGKHTISKLKSFLVQTGYEAFTKRWFRLPLELRQSHRISEAVEYLDSITPDSSKDDSAKPVFLLSAGWRSGSTLLQRLIISSGEIAMWGEPLGESAIIARLAYSLAPISERWPMKEYMDPDPNLHSLANKWIANLTPPLANLKSAHRAFLDAWLAEPAKRQYNVDRWALKEVRLSIDHAVYLKWLYPKAKFVFICRNVHDAYRSWRGNRWGSEWPDYFTWSPFAFANHWKHLTRGYIEGCSKVDGFLIRFEDLVNGGVDLDDLAAYLEVNKIRESVLDRKIGKMDKKDRKRVNPQITMLERKLLNLTAGKTLKQFYSIQS